MKELVIIGSGGHALSCLDVIQSTSEFKIVGFVDNILKEKWLGLSWLGTDKDLLEISKKCNHFFIGVGQIKDSLIRQRIYQQITSFNGNLPTIISPNAYVSPMAKIGQGSIVMHGSHVGPEARIGEGCILNTKCLIEHGAQIGKFVHASTAAVVNGDVVVGAGSFLGSNSVICHGVKIPHNSFIQAGQFIGRKHEWR